VEQAVAGFHVEHFSAWPLSQKDALDYHGALQARENIV
jgi:hypothetical protein